MINSTFTAPGHGHKNEDVVTIQSHPQDSEFLLCALADGQGGQFGGGNAAFVAAMQCIKTASSHSVNELCEADRWRAVLHAADVAVSRNTDAGYTTLIGFCVSRDLLRGASCGDSALLLVHNGAQVSWLTERQKKNPPVGSGGAMPVAFSAALQGDWKLLAMSDGVYKFAEWEAIIEIVQRQRGENLIEALHQTVLQNNAGKLPDDFSIALFQGDVS